MRYALVREISDRLSECELTHLQRTPIDLDRARAQHAAYCGLLKKLGCHIITLSASDELPDCVFIEDAALVLDELAIMTRPGAESRRGEIATVEDALAPHRRIERIIAPGTLEGGDVIVHDKVIYIGRSSRTNAAGIDQLAGLVQREGYTVRPVAMSGCLHLKSGATLVTAGEPGDPSHPGAVLINRDWVDPNAFKGPELIDVHPEEPRAACAVLIGDTVIHAASFAGTRAIMAQRGIDVHTIEYDELAKAEAGVTCCSIVFNGPWKPRLAE